MARDRRERKKSALSRSRFFPNRAELALLLNEFGDDAGPAGLMRRAEASAGVAMEVFVKQIPIAVTCLVQTSRRACKRWLTILAAHPEFDQQIGKVVGDFFEG